MPEPIITEKSNNLDSRLSVLERALKLDERIKALEVSLVESNLVEATKLPWWKDSKTITILAALIAAVLPLITAIDGILKNNRDSEKLLIEQQDKIRQTYLDRVLKTGINEGEQQRLFGLLLKLKSDPELQQWAKEEYDKTTDKIDALKRTKEDLENKNREQQNEIDRLLNAAQQLGAHKEVSKSRIRTLQVELAESKQVLAELGHRIGEPQSGKPGTLWAEESKVVRVDANRALRERAANQNSIRSR